MAKVKGPSHGSNTATTSKQNQDAVAVTSSEFADASAVIS